MSAVQPHILDSISELQRLADLFAHRREQLARSVGLSVQQWRILEEISDEDFMPSMFARRRVSSAAAVSKIIRQLIDKRLIDVSVSGEDGRVRRYNLTAEGEQVMERLRANRQIAMKTIWSGIEPEQLLEFQKFATQLSDRLEQYSENEASQQLESLGRKA